MNHNKLFKENLKIISHTESQTLLRLMCQYNIPKRRIVEIITKTPMRIENIVEFLLHMEEYCDNFNSKKARNKLWCYEEFRMSGISNYKCCVLLVDWGGELG